MEKVTLDIFTDVQEELTQEDGHVEGLGSTIMDMTDSTQVELEDVTYESVESAVNEGIKKVLLDDYYHDVVDRGGTWEIIDNIKEKTTLSVHVGNSWSTPKNEGDPNIYITFYCSLNVTSE